MHATWLTLAVVDSPLSDLVASLSLVVVSTLLVLFALRCRRVNDHPICRRCGFDLFGKPAESTVCSECGADLGRRRAVQVGQRERDGRVLALAVPMLVLSLGWSGWDGWRRARGVDWNARKPVWWLVREANGRNPAARDAALTELTRRIRSGRLTHGQQDALVNRALEIQADLSRTWLPAWGTLVEAAHDTGGLSQEQWQRYVVQAPTLVLESQPALVRRCDEFYLLIRTGAERTGGASAMRGQAVEAMRIAVYADRQMLVDGRAVEASTFIPAHVFLQRSKWINTEPAPHEIEPNEIPLVATSVMPGPPRPRAQGPGALALPVEARLPDWLPDGPRTVRVKLHLILLCKDRNPSGKVANVRVGPDRTVEMETAFTLTPAAIENHDPALAKAVEQTLSVDQLIYQGSGPSGRMEGVLRCSGTPVPIAYEVLIAYSYYQHSAGTACFLPGDSPSEAGLLDRIDFGDKPPDKVDVQLFPDRRLLPPGTKETCGSLIILKNIPVVHVRAPSGNTKATGDR